MLALGNTIGLTAGGIALLAAVRRARGAAALAGTGRAALSGVAAAAAGAAAGAATAIALPSAGPVADALDALIATACAAGVFAIVAFLLDGGALRAAVIRIRAGELR
jgi:putative peptidoglycan lipid II flippase